MQNYFDNMSGEEFEKYVAEILDIIGFYNITLTKCSGDQGVDIVAEKDGLRYAFQCKRYSFPVGNKAVQEIYSGKSYYRCNIGVVVTNNVFTNSAKELAFENGIVLWDINFLNRYVRKKSNNCFRDKLNFENGFSVFKNNYMSKKLYEYLNSYSLEYIKSYIERNDLCDEEKEIIENMGFDIKLYNAKCYEASEYNILYTYYCSLKETFYNTETYKKFLKLNLQNGDIFCDNLVSISVYYSLSDIYLKYYEIIIDKVEEISIFTSNNETLEIEMVDDDKSTYEKTINENYFPILKKNII